MNRNFDIITDTCTGMTDEFYEKNEITVLPLGYTMDGVTYGGIDGKTQPIEEFYKDLFAGKEAHTFQVTAEQARPHIEASFEKGKDVLIVAFSSALSGTASSFNIAAAEAEEKYPGRKALIIDSLGGCMGQGLLMEYLLKEAEKGKSIDEVFEYGQDLRYKIQYIFTVDDLQHLKRGGRISSTVAIVGQLLKIKPLLHASATGALVPFAKIVGRKHSLEALVKEATKRADLDDDDPIFIAHGNSPEAAEQLYKLTKEYFGENRRIEVNLVDPVMAIHGGPGVAALFFKGKPRNEQRPNILSNLLNKGE